MIQNAVKIFKIKCFQLLELYAAYSRRKIKELHCLESNPFVNLCVSTFTFILVLARFSSSHSAVSSLSFGYSTGILYVIQSLLKLDCIGGVTTSNISSSAILLLPLFNRSFPASGLSHRSVLPIQVLKYLEFGLQHQSSANIRTVFPLRWLADWISYNPKYSSKSLTHHSLKN